MASWNSARLGRWIRTQSRGCFAVRGRDDERPLTCDAGSPTVTARARRGPAVPLPYGPSVDRWPGPGVTHARGEGMLRRRLWK
jgi:hypothetical protein